jgi:hypothetical protein
MSRYQVNAQKKDPLTHQRIAASRRHPAAWISTRPLYGRIAQPAAETTGISATHAWFTHSPLAHTSDVVHGAPVAALAVHTLLMHASPSVHGTGVPTTVKVDGSQACPAPTTGTHCPIAAQYRPGAHCW